MTLFDIDTEIATAISNSGNSSTTNTTNTTNTSNLAVDLDNVGNTDASVNDSGNLDVGVEGSFHSNSYNQDWDVDHSGNTGSYNTSVDVMDGSTTDNSVNAGLRSYNTGFGDVELGGGGSGGDGDTWINNQNTVLDQSSNGNILSGGSVFQHSGDSAVVASGDGAMAAGGNISVDQTLYGGTSIDAGGDVLIDSTKTVDSMFNSGNTSNVDIDVTDASQHWDLDNVGNQYSATLDIDGSFNEETVEVDYDDWDVDADVIWDSNHVAIVDGDDLDL